MNVRRQKPLAIQLVISTLERSVFCFGSRWDFPQQSRIRVKEITVMYAVRCCKGKQGNAMDFSEMDFKEI
jgi:hypothetical protein